MNATDFVINLTKKRTTEEIIKAGNYDEVNFLIKEAVRKKRISIQNEAMGKRRIVLLDNINNNTNSQKVLTEAKRNGLNRPTYGDAFLFGEQHPEEQIKGPIVFLHDPPYLWSGHLFSLVLDVNCKGRIISLISSGNWWDKKFRFAFRDKQNLL